MDDLIELLERTTPRVSMPDAATLTRRARGRRRRRAACVVSPLVALAAVAIVLRPAAEHRVATTNAQHPIGTWRRTSRPPLDLTAQVRTATLPDGRILVVAGSFDIDVPAHPFETALYDANTDQWARLATAPVAHDAHGADLLTANDRIVLLTHDDPGNVSVALLDGHSLQWRSVPIPTQDGHVFDAWAWDGTTLVLARFSNHPFGAPAGPPIVERWNADTNTWRQGTAPPTAPRFYATVARSAHRLAVWGGYTFETHAAGSMPTSTLTSGGATTPTTSSPGVDRPRRAFTDGAIYDIARDTWTYLTPQPSLAAEVTRGPAAAILTSSTLTLVSSQVYGVLSIVVRYEHGRWHRLPSPSATGGAGSIDQETATIAISAVEQSGSHPAQYLDGSSNRWRAAPAYELVQSQHGLLATSATSGGPDNSAFSVWRLDGTTWTPATPAPFLDRMEPGIGVTGDQLLVIGGQAGPNLEPQRDAWLLDFTPTQ